MSNYIARGLAWGTLTASPAAYAEGWHQLYIGEHAMTLAIAGIFGFAVFLSTYVIDHTKALPPGSFRRRKAS